jgi:hypothetical protein
MVLKGGNTNIIETDTDQGGRGGGLGREDTYEKKKLKG